MDTYKNFAISAVATAPSPATSGTSLVVTSGHGTRFPTPPFNATIWPGDQPANPSNAEIVRVTNISTDTLTITRAQEGSSARSIVVGDRIAATITVKTLTDLQTFEWDGVIIKAADETINSNATLQDDNELQFAAVAGGSYYIEILLVYGGDSTADLKHGFAVSAGTITRIWRKVVGWHGTTASGTEAMAAESGVAQTSAMALACAGGDRMVSTIHTGFQVGSDCTFKFQWAQNSSNANNTSVFAGSVLRYRRLV